jgi:hypothetical protein
MNYFIIFSFLLISEKRRWTKSMKLKTSNNPSFLSLLQLQTLTLIMHPLIQGWQTSTRKRATQFNKYPLEGHTCVYACRKGEGTELTIRPLFTNKKITLKLRSNCKAVGPTEPDKIQRITGLLPAAFKVIRYDL